ncbi:MAG: cysteine hydrolase [Caldilineaceae bacterium]|nr:cysteine hydrolase [Caldilineaceae bacterium]
MSKNLHLHLRSHALDHNAQGWAIWREEIVERSLLGHRVAIVICDMWDQHWSRGAAERVGAMVARMEGVLSTARGKGVHIIHAPSETMGFYTDHPARQRILALPPIAPPPDRVLPDPPLPIDDRDGGSDTGEPEMAQVWTRQHPGLTIDPARDVISDNGLDVYSYLRQHAIEQVLILGVHTNMCVLRRSFAIKQMVKWGQPIALVRDLTDTMYNPASAPYVSHDEGTQLVIGYIERFWCPSVSSLDIVG